MHSNKDIHSDKLKNPSMYGTNTFSHTLNTPNVLENIYVCVSVCIHKCTQII